MRPALLIQSRAQYAVAIAGLLAISPALVALVWVGPMTPDHGVSAQKLFASGSFAAFAGLVCAAFGRRRMTLMMSAVTLAVGAVALALLVLPPDAPALVAVRRLMPLSRQPPGGEFGSWLFMDLTILTCGVALPFAGATGQLRAQLALNVARAGVWAGVFWQLSYVALDGRFTRLFQPGAVLAVQSFLALTTVAVWMWLLRGDRRWLETPAGASIRPSLTRYLLPVALAPVIIAFLAEVGRRQGFYDPDVRSMLKVELNAAVDMLVFAAALRTIWLERAGKEALARALERSPVIVCTEAGVIEYWPRGCEALYGYTAAEAIGRRADELLRTSYPDSDAATRDILFRDGEWSGELRQIARDGGVVWVSSRRLLDHAEADGRARIVESISDVTALRQSDTELKEATESFTQAVAAYDLGIVEFDGRTGENRYSAEFERLVGASPGSLPPDQDGWRALLAAEDVDRMAGWIAADMATKATRRNVEVRLRHADGGLRDAQGMLRYTYTDSGRLIRIVGIYMDVTEHLRDRAEAAARGERLLELQSELTHVARLSAMGEMAATLAHELNQPLTAVGTAVGAIPLIVGDGHKPLAEKQRGMLLRAAAHAEEQVVRAGEIVRRLREFIARGEMDTRKEDLSDLVRDAVHLALPNPAAAGIEVAIQIAPAASQVLASRVQVQQVLVNLIRNAAEAMGDQAGPRLLTIQAEPVRGMALVRVTDTGPGIDPEVADHLFTPFRSGKASGMGVGLSISRRIIEAHEGRLWFEAAGGGGDFRFTLPLFTETVREPDERLAEPSVAR